MHGLIFETSVWLLAGSTRLISSKSFSQLQTSTQRKQPLQNEGPLALSNGIFSSSGQSHPEQLYVSRSNFTTDRTKSNATDSQKVSFLTQTASFNFILQNWENPKKLHAQLHRHADIRHQLQSNQPHASHKPVKVHIKDFKVLKRRDSDSVNLLECPVQHEPSKRSVLLCQRIRLQTHSTWRIQTLSDSLIHTCIPELSKPSAQDMTKSSLEK